MGLFTLVFLKKKISRELSSQNNEVSPTFLTVSEPHSRGFFHRVEPGYSNRPTPPSPSAPSRLYLSTSITLNLSSPG